MASSASSGPSSMPIAASRTDMMASGPRPAAQTSSSRATSSASGLVESIAASNPRPGPELRRAVAGTRSWSRSGHMLCRVEASHRRMLSVSTWGTGRSSRTASA